MNKNRPQAENIDDVRCLREFGFREFSPASLREYATFLTGFLFSENGNLFTDRVLYEAACISLSSTYLRNEHLLRIADMQFLMQYVRTADTAENMNNKPMVTLQPRDNRGLMGRLYESLTVTGPLFEVFQHPCLYEPQFLQKFQVFCSENDSQHVFSSLPGSQELQTYLQPLVSFADGQFDLPLFYWCVFGPTSCLCDWLLTFVLQALECSQILSTAFAFALRGIASPVFMQKEIEFWKRLKGLTMQLSHSARIPLLKVPIINADSVLTENLRCVFHNIMETVQKPFHYMNKLRIPDTLLHASLDDNVISIHLPCQQPYLVLRLLTDTDVDEQDEDGNTVLHLAADLGQFDAIKLAVYSGASIAVKNKAGLTPPQLAALRNRDNVQRDRKSWLDLCKACKSGDTNKVKTLLCYDCHDMLIGEIDMENRTPLHYASNRGQTEVVSLLIDLQADVNVTDHLYQTPLILACNRNHIETAKLLISRGADVNIPLFIGFSPLYVACMNGQKELVDILLQHSADVSVRCGNGETPLAVACTEGHWDVAKLLLQYHADINVSLSEDCVFTLLHEACCEGQYQLAEFVLQHKADPDLETGQGLKYRPSRYDISLTQKRSSQPISVSATTQRWFKPCYNDAPIHLACYKGHANIVQLLVSHGASVDAQREDGATALHVACQTGNIDVVRALISCDAHLYLKNSFNETPLLTAFSYGTTELVRLLLQHRDVQLYVNDPDQFGLSPLHYACIFGDKDIVEVLLEKGANVNSVCTLGMTPLHWICIKDQYGVAEVLLRNGADLSVVDTSGHIPLHLAWEMGYTELVSVLLQSNGFLNVFTIDIQDFKNETALLHACYDKHINFVEILLKHNADINLTDSCGQSLLYKVCERGFSDMTKLLLKKGADLNARDKKSQTPLFLACKKGHVDTVRLLLHNNADIHIKDYANSTALDVAQREGQTHIVAALLNKHSPGSSGDTEEDEEDNDEEEIQS